MLGMEAERCKRKLSREEFAGMLGVLPHTVWRWESGERNPSLDMLRRIAKIFEKPIDYLINPTQSPAKPGARGARTARTARTA